MFININYWNSVLQTVYYKNYKTCCKPSCEIEPLKSCCPSSWPIFGNTDKLEESSNILRCISNITMKLYNGLKKSGILIQENCSISINRAYTFYNFAAA